MEYTEEQIDGLILGIYSGYIDLNKLPKTLYDACFERLYSGVRAGYLDYDLVMLNALKTDVYLFSGAKTFNYVLSTKNLIIDDDNKKIPLREFKKLAKENFGLYYETWLETEYATAINQSSSIRQWQEAMDSPNDLIEYVTVRDSHVSDICRQYDGLIYPKNHPIWNKISPLNHYRCRCLIRTVATGVVSSKTYSGFEFPVMDGFDRNAAVDKIIYPQNHPYYDVPKKYVKLAKSNFGLPIK